MSYNDNYLKEILKESKTIAVVGLSNKSHRASFHVGKYLVEHGYKVLPVHPNIKEWETLSVYQSLKDIEESVDIVDLFRNSESIPEMIDEIVNLKPKTVWMQLGISNQIAKEAFESKGIKVVEDRCIMVEHQRFF